MKKIVAGLMAGALAAAQLAGFSAIANAGDCACATAVTGAKAGYVTKAGANALIAGAAGYVTAKSGTPLYAGSQVISGAKGRTTVAVGGCNMTVPANATLTIENMGAGKVCLKVSKVGITPASAEAGAAAGSVFAGQNIVPMVAGLALIGGGIAIAVSSSDHSASD